MKTTKTKVCNTCKKRQPLLNYGHNKARPGGLQDKCKSCYQIYNEENRKIHNISKKSWRQRNLEKSRASARRTYHKHKHKRKEYGKKYAQDNKDKINARNRQNYYKHIEHSRQLACDRYKKNPKRGAANRLKNKDKINARQRNNYWKNPEYGRARTTTWRKDNSEKVAVSKQRRRAREVNAEGSFTTSEWKTKCLEWGNRCAYCLERTKLTVHHIQPLSKGGSNWITNLVPACKSCNCRIHTKVIYPGTEICQ